MDVAESVMTETKKFSKRLDLSIHSQLTGAVLMIGVALGSLSLFGIALRVGPMARYASSFNGCVATTVSFLSEVPGFRSAGAAGLEAMSVSLCNGSTPQRNENTSDQSK